MGDLPSRLIGPCARFLPETREVTVDIPALMRRLLLFDTVVLQTIRFAEFVPLVRTLGIDNVLLLLKSGALELELDPTQIAQSGQVRDQPAIREKPPLPELSFAFSLIKPAQYNDYLLKNLQQVRRDLYGSVSQDALQKLAAAVLLALLPNPDESGFVAIRDLYSELRAGSAIFTQALAMNLQQFRGIKVSRSELSVHIVPLDETDIKVECNLDTYGLDPGEAHKHIQASLLAVGALSSKIERMKNYAAISGVTDVDAPLFAEKYVLLAEALSPTKVKRESCSRAEENFSDMLRVLRLPTFEFSPPDRSFDMERFLEIRTSQEAVEFRAWLRNLHSASDQDAANQLMGIRNKLSPFVHGTGGKVVRLVVPTVTSFLADLHLPGSGTALGLGLGALDLFILEKLFPLKGPHLFLSRIYASLFEESRKS